MCIFCIYLKLFFLYKHLVNSIQKIDAIFFKKVNNNLFLIFSLYLLVFLIIKDIKKWKLSTVFSQYNEPYILADQAFIISNFVNTIMNYLV
jgi:hypothetical protein